MMSSDASKKPQKRFQFIDNSNIASSGTNSTQVRRHVMQEYMREKRWEARSHAEAEVLEPEPQRPIRRKSAVPRNRKQDRRRPKSNESISTISPESQNDSSLPLNSWPNALAQRDIPQEDVTTSNLRNPLAVSDVISALPQKRRSASFQLTPDSFAHLAELLPDASYTPTSSIHSGESWSPISDSASSDRLSNGTPLSLLSAARTDPFDTLPLALSDKDKELFDFYATVMPSCSYGFERRDPRAHNWYLSVFIPEAMKGPVTFQNTVLVHAANTQAWVMNLTETPLAIEHRARASEILSKHYQQHPHDTSDAIITATMSAAALEDFDPRLERKPIAWLHWQAALQKIRDRGGPSSLEQKPSLRRLVNWQDYIFSGYDGRGSTFYFTNEMSARPLHETDAEAIGRQEIAQQCEEFIIFLKCTEQLAIVTSNMWRNAGGQLSQPCRHSAFRPDHPLFILLASPNGPRYTKTGQHKQVISRLASLMTINVAIWEYRYRTEASEAFLTELVDDILHNDLDKNISVEALLQILLSGSANPELQHSERPWLVSRLLKVAKRLGRDSWERLNDFLLDCLSLSPGLQPIVQEWEPTLRKEILDAPLVSHVLPLMQG